jgi:hypothetical protein
MEPEQGMSDVLRRAADALYNEWEGPRGGGWLQVRTFHLAAADWLDEQAVAYAANEHLWRESSRDPENRWAERGLTVEANLEHHYKHALAVARAYLGESA